MGIAAGLALALVLVAAQAPDPPAGKGRTVVVGVFDRPPLVHALGDDRVRDGGGLFVELLEAAVQREGWRLERRPCSPAQCLEQLGLGVVDVVPAVAGSATLGAGVALTNEPVISTWSQVWVRGGRRVHSLLDLDRLTVAVTTGDVAATELRALADRLGLGCVFAEVASSRVGLEALAKGWVDAAVVDRLEVPQWPGSTELDQTPLVLSPVALHYAVRDDPDRVLQTTLDFHLRALKRDPSSRYHELVTRTFGLEVQPRLPAGVLGALAVVVGLLLAALPVGVILRRQVRRATAALATRNRELEEEVATRREVEARLRRSTLLLERAFASMRDGLLVVDPTNDRTVDCNRSAAVILGYPRGELLKLAAAEGRRHVGLRSRGAGARGGESRPHPLSPEALHRLHVSRGAAGPVGVRPRGAGHPGPPSLGRVTGASDRARVRFTSRGLSLELSP